MDNFTFEQLVSLIRYHFNEMDTSITFQRTSTGKFNTAFYVYAGDQQLVLRIAPAHNVVLGFYERGMMSQEQEIHKLLLSQTTVPVARIFAYDNSHRLINRAYIIMERLPGCSFSEIEGVDIHFVLRQVGAYLAQVHRLIGNRYGYLGAHRPMEPQHTWAAAFHVMWKMMIHDIAALGYYSPEEAHRLRGLLKQHLPLFDRPVPSSLLHMDLWRQNVLVDNSGNVTGILDWERAAWGDPEIDFAFLDYCGMSEPALWEGYDLERDQSEQARMRYVFYLLYHMQKDIIFEHSINNDQIGAQEFKRQVIEMAYEHLIEGVKY